MSASHFTVQLSPCVNSIGSDVSAPGHCLTPCLAWVVKRELSLLNPVGFNQIKKAPNIIYGDEVIVILYMIFAYIAISWNSWTISLVS